MFNIIDVIVILIILLSVFMGYKKGFIKTVINLASFFVAIALALMFYKPLAVILTENTEIDDWIISNIASSEEEKTINEENIENDFVSNDDVAENDNKILDILNNLPSTITENAGLEEIKNNAKQEIAYKVSELIMNLLSLILIYVVVKVTLLIASIVLNGIMQIPVLKQLNEILGMAIGAVIGFIQIYMVFAVMTFLSSVCDLSIAITAIKASAFASILFENNIIIKLLF